MSTFQNNDLIFTLAIDPPNRNAECVKIYNISVISENQVNTVHIPANGYTEVFVNISKAILIDFNPCLANYSFQVQASNSEERSNIYEGVFNFSGKLSIFIITCSSTLLKMGCLDYLDLVLNKRRYLDTPV